METKIKIVTREEPSIDPKVIESLQQLAAEDNDLEFVPDILNYYLEKTPQALETIRDAILRADGKTVTGLAHMLKGASGNIGALQMADLCSSLEKSARSGDLDPADGLLVKMQTEFDYAKSELQAILLQSQSA